MIGPETAVFNGQCDHCGDHEGDCQPRGRPTNARSRHASPRSPCGKPTQSNRFETVLMPLNRRARILLNPSHLERRTPRFDEAAAKLAWERTYRSVQALSGIDTWSQHLLEQVSGHNDTDGGRLPAVVVVHENRGLNPYIEDVTRRVAKAGLLSARPGRPDRSAAIPAMMKRASSSSSRWNPRR